MFTISAHAFGNHHVLAIYRHRDGQHFIYKPYLPSKMAARTTMGAIRYRITRGIASEPGTWTRIDPSWFNRHPQWASLTAEAPAQQLTLDMEAT